nr:hypothetical protein CFP56_10216 [Quercus suber]
MVHPVIITVSTFIQTYCATTTNHIPTIQCRTANRRGARDHLTVSALHYRRARTYRRQGKLPDVDRASLAACGGNPTPCTATAVIRHDSTRTRLSATTRDDADIMTSPAKLVTHAFPPPPGHPRCFSLQYL